MTMRIHLVSLPAALFAACAAGTLPQAPTQVQLALTPVGKPWSAPRQRAARKSTNVAREAMRPGRRGPSSPQKPTSSTSVALAGLRTD